MFQRNFQDPDPRPPPSTPVAEPKRPLHPRLESVQVWISLNCEIPAKNDERNFF